MELQPGQSVYSTLTALGLMTTAVCGGNGYCGKCKIKILSGKLCPITATEMMALTTEELNAGYRLACQAIACSDISIQIHENTYGENHAKDLVVLPDFFYQCLARQEFVCEQKKAIDRWSRASSAYGFAYDIGTTTVAGSLWDLKSNSCMGTLAKQNPQCVHGGDVITRIEYALLDKNHIFQMQQEVLLCINEIAEELLDLYHISPSSVCRITVAGNMTMSHILMGVSVDSLARMPCVPVFCAPVTSTAGEMGLHVNPAAEWYLLPQIAGHVGADITGVVIATNIFELDGVSVVIDIGTNGEILVAKGNQILACSTAAGPAFEGAKISCGMRAAKGAIEQVRFDSNDVSIKVIGNVPPKGLCGSGLIDVLAGLNAYGLINAAGKLLNKEEAQEKEITDSLTKRLFGEGLQSGFLLYSDKDRNVSILQQDIREAQLAKGAIFGGILTLLNKLHLNVEDIDRILIAGAFGNCINIDSALKIGLIPPVGRSHVFSIGNAAGVGASMVLLSDIFRKRAEVQARKIKHIELARDEIFQQMYTKGMFFPVIEKGK